MEAHKDGEGSYVQAHQSEVVSYLQANQDGEVSSVEDFVRITKMVFSAAGVFSLFFSKRKGKKKKIMVSYFVQLHLRYFF